jgi:hypothetical protein
MHEAERTAGRLRLAVTERHTGLVPFGPSVLRTGLIRAMLNFEIPEYPVYDALELQ